MKNSKIINIFYHDDFDGISSAGIFANFLNWYYKKECVFDYYGIDYDKVFEFLRKDFNVESAVLDYPFHPQAKWWFDHHKTSFYSDEIKSLYSKGKFHYWNTRAKSCPSLLFSFFKKNYKDYYKLVHSNYRKLIEYSNIIDSASYRNPMQPYDFSNNYIALNHILNIDHTPALIEKYINKIKEIDLNTLFNSELFIGLKEKAASDFESKAIELKEKITVKNNVAILEISRPNDFRFNTRYISYYFYPGIDYTIIKSKRNDSYYIGVGYNPWKSDNKHHIGSFFKRFCGGGRKNVGAVLINDSEKYNYVASEVIKYFT